MLEYYLMERNGRRELLAATHADGPAFYRRNGYTVERVCRKQMRKIKAAGTPLRKY